MIDMPAPAPVGYRREFNAKAGPLAAKVGEADVTLKPRRFPSGALGWSSGNQIVYVQVAGRWLRCRATVTVKVVESHRWSEVSDE